MLCLMKWAVVIAMAVGLAEVREAGAQASFTATQTLALSAFGGLSGNYTDLEGGKNLGITAGVDLALPTYHRYRPVLEGRGTYALDGGSIDAQKEVLGGLRVERQFRRWHPYLDFLAGRGQIDYQNHGFSYGDFTYISSTSTVYSGGGGLDVDLTRHLSVRGDVQVQHWDTPFPATTPPVPVTVTQSARVRPDVVIGAPGTAPQTIYPTMGTLAVVYRFDFNHHYRRRR